MHRTEDCLVIGFDCSPSEIATLAVARKEGEKLMVVNMVYGKEALEIYDKLTRSPMPLKERYNKLTEMYNKLGDKTKQKDNKKKRKYYRKCGICGDRYEQSEMLRTNDSPNGWLCWDCRNIVDPEYED